jgi:hypothetical protein
MKSNVVPYIRFKFFGDWVGYTNKIRNLSPDLYASMLYGQRKAATRLAAVVVGHLKNQDIPGWEPKMNPSASGDTRTLIDTGTYLNNIRAWRDNFSYYVGVKRGIKSSSGVEVARYAMIHEAKSYTTGGPYRPLWGPSVEEMGGAEGMRDIVKAVIIKKLALRGWRVKNFNI